MDVYGYLRISDEGRKSQIQHASKIEPSGGKSHAPDSIFVVPMSNSRILASKPLASSCLGGNREAKSLGLVLGMGVIGTYVPPLPPMWGRPGLNVGVVPPIKAPGS